MVLKTVYLALILWCVAWTHLPASAEAEKGRGFYDFGVFAYEDREYDAAEKNFRKALQCAPDNPLYHHFLGKTYLKTGRYPEAERHFITAWKADSDLPGLRYDLAFLNYKTGKYAEAADLFQQVATESPSNVMAQYYAGISLFQQDRYGAAIPYFLSAGESSPTLRENSCYYAGVCYQKSGQPDAAIEKFQYVRDHALSASLRENAVRWLQGTAARADASVPYRFYLKIGYQYDDNVLLASDAEEIASDEGDYATEVFASGEYRLVNTREFELGGGYSHYQIWYNELTDYDMSGSILSLYMKYRLPSLSLGLRYFQPYYQVDSDNYLRRHQIRPELTWKPAQNLLAKLTHSYYDNHYFEDPDRTGHTRDVSLDIYYSLADNRGHLFGGLCYEDTNASDPDHFYEQFKTRMGITLRLPWQLEISLVGRYYARKYDHADSDYGVKRDDAKYHGSVSLSRRLFCDELHVVAEFTHTQNDSNINIYEYERNSATLSLTAAY